MIDPVVLSSFYLVFDLIEPRDRERLRKKERKKTKRKKRVAID